MTTLDGELRTLRAQLGDLDAEIAKFQQEIDNRVAERDRVAFAVTVLERIDTPTTSVNAEPTQSPRGPRGRRLRIGGTSEYVLKALQTLGHPAGIAEEIIPAMRAHGWAAHPADEVETVRAALSRAVRDGLAVRNGSGLYGLPDSAAADEAAAEGDPGGAGPHGDPEEGISDGGIQWRRETPPSDSDENRPDGAPPLEI